MDKLTMTRRRILRGRFQWPAWLLDWAWNRQATPWCEPGAAPEKIELPPEISQ